MGILDVIISGLRGKDSVADLDAGLEKIDDGIAKLVAEEADLQTKIAVAPFEATADEFQSLRNRLATVRADIETLGNVRVKAKERRNAAAHDAAKAEAMATVKTAKAAAGQMLELSGEFDQKIADIERLGAQMLELNNQIIRANHKVEQAGFADLKVHCAGAFGYDLTRLPALGQLRAMSPHATLVMRHERGEF